MVSNQIDLGVTAGQEKRDLFGKEIDGLWKIFKCLLLELFPHVINIFVGAEKELPRTGFFVGLIKFDEIYANIRILARQILFPTAIITICFNRRDVLKRTASPIANNVK